MSIEQLIFCMLGSYVCFVIGTNYQIKYYNKSFQLYHQAVKQFESRSGQICRWACPGPTLIAKVINRQNPKSNTLPCAPKNNNNKVTAA